MSGGTFLEDGEEEVQQPALMSLDRRLVRHLLLQFPPDARPTGRKLGISSPAHFLDRVLQHCQGCQGLASVARALSDRSSGKRPLLTNLAFTFRGLQRLDVPAHILNCMALRSPAFAAGAPVRAAGYMGDNGPSDAACWSRPFALDRLHAVITLHADEREEIDDATDSIRKAACVSQPRARVTRLPLGETRFDSSGHAVLHFGLSDGLSRVGIRRLKELQEKVEPRLEKISRHEVGEFVLGYPDDTRANPWIRDMAGKILPPLVRKFFVHGGFGVLRQMSQDTVGFADFVREAGWKLPHRLGIVDPQARRDYVVSRLVGRWPDGWRSRAQTPTLPSEPPDNDFDYVVTDEDPTGLACPFGAHIRRMNPRGTPVAQPFPRPLMRRGMSYGPQCSGEPDGVDRGLLGLFFCASIEEQFEHLLGQWGDRVPLGSPDPGDAKDPLVGNNRPGACFYAPHRGVDSPLVITTLRSFVTTRGTAYLFYPSLSTVQGIIDSSLWIAPEDIPR